MDCRDYKCTCQCGEVEDLQDLFDDLECSNINVCDCYDDGREYCRRPQPKPIPRKGIIEVQCLLGCSDGEPISGMPVQLYKVDCNTGFELVACKYTDRCGKCVFKCLEDGLYAVKQPVDRCYFEDPQYYPCYEVCISPRHKFGRVIVINRLKDRDDCNRPPIRCRCNTENSCE